MKKQDYISLAEGHSLALKVNYKPQILHELANHLVRGIEEEHLEISDVIEDICDAYEKLGYMLYAENSIKELDTKTPYYHLVIQYHVINFIFYCKSFLDSISNAIYHAFDLDIKKPVNIDITREEFIKKLTPEKPNIAVKINQFLVWGKYIRLYRMELIHKYRFFPLSKDLNSSELEIFHEPTRPFTILDKTSLDTFTDKLTKKYGSPMININSFCRENLDNAKNLFEIVISELHEEIHSTGPNVFGWERLNVKHISRH